MRNVEKNVDNILWGKQIVVCNGERESRRYLAYKPLGVGQPCPGQGVGGDGHGLFLPVPSPDTCARAISQLRTRSLCEVIFHQVF